MELPMCVCVYIFKNVITNTKCYHQKQKLVQKFPTAKLARYKAKIHVPFLNNEYFH